MKRLFFFAAAFVTGFSALSQQKADDVIKLNAEKYDFGKIKQGVPVTTYFTITNISDKPVVIENAWAGCGCTTPEVTKGPIAPKGTTQLKVGFNAATMNRFDKEVYVKLAGVQEPKIIKISGEVLDANAYATYTKTPEYKKAMKIKKKEEKKNKKDNVTK
jgi:hypothetical protein